APPRRGRVRPYLEASLSRRVLRRARPSDVRELADALALVEPGAAQARDASLKRRHGTEPVTDAHPNAERALSGTYGCLLSGTPGQVERTLLVATLVAIGSEILAREQGSGDDQARQGHGARLSFTAQTGDSE